MEIWHRISLHYIDIAKLFVGVQHRGNWCLLMCSENGSQESYRNNDGFFTRKLPAELLKDINIVDTPGTNVIVDRQQRLTEEYVPRADLVLFCMSAG